MGIDGPPLLTSGLALMLLTAGFHGLFFHRNLLKKALSWGALQAGIILLLIALARPEGAGFLPPNPLARALAFCALAVSAGVLSALLTVCLVVRDRYGTLDGEKLDEEGQG